MARRRPQFKRPMPNYGIPTPVAFKAPTLDIPKLQTAYDWMTVNKTVGFKLVFEWYGQNMTALLYGSPLDAEKQKSYDRATKAKALGDSSNMEGEKIQAWSTALHLFEKIWAGKGLIQLDDAVLNTTPGLAVANIQTVLRNLNTVFPQTSFRVTFNSTREFLEGEILIPNTELDQMVGAPPLTVVLNEVPLVANVISLKTDSEGKMILNEKGNGEVDDSKFRANLPLLLTQVSSWANGDKTVFKPIGKPAIHIAPVLPKVSGAKKAAGPRTPSGKVTATDPFGFFRRDTLDAAVASILHDRNVHMLSDLSAFCVAHGYIASSAVQNCLQHMKAKGIVINRTKSSVQVV